MFRSRERRILLILLGGVCLALVSGTARAGGEVEGRVTLETSGKAIHSVSVLIVQLGLTVETDHQGHFRFQDVPAGSYDILAHSGALSSSSHLIDVTDNTSLTIDFRLKINPIRQEITVTARGQEETVFEAVQSVTSVDSYALAQKMAPSLGEALDGEAGVSKRSYGPGSSRPVIRGFDGDRVLVMEDGIRVGSLAAQSGDHGEPIDPGNLERVEIVKGPATLLYGGNAIGGVVNAVTGHHALHQRAHQGLTGQLTSGVGTTNGHAGASARAEFGEQGWLLWAGGGGQRSGNYDTPQGAVENSESRITNASAGVGYFGDRAYLSFGYTTSHGRYGIPQAQPGEDPQPEGMQETTGSDRQLQEIDIDFQRHNYRLSSGLQNLDTAVKTFEFSLNYSDWQHKELEQLAGGIEEVGTRFDNGQWIYRGVFEQRPAGKLAGRFGFWGLLRDYDVAGDEALSPPVDQNTFALFSLQELSMEGVKLQFGARLEFTDYRVKGLQFRPTGHSQGGTGKGDTEGQDPILLPDRDLTNVSAGIGARFQLGANGAFIANFTSSSRAPALEELYNFGPHVGNLAFEIGDPSLKSERSNGLDVSFRRHHDRVHANASFFYYDISDFIYLQLSGAVVDGLLEGEYTQADSRFAGAEFRFDAGLHEHLWLNLGLDVVDAQLTDLNQSLPRIPPLKGRVGLDFRNGGVSVRPEMVLTASQRGERLAPQETPTAGYAVLNLKASYTIPRQHFLHQLSFDFFNLGDRLYRNHVSFIKNAAPEIGRGIRFAYTVKFF